MTIAYSNATSSIGNISATVKLLEQFGNTRVLSSPKLMALNNQTALLKVVDNVVYFSIEASQSVTQGATAQVFNTTAHTVPVGMVMNMTPQINENGQVTLTVRPTVTRISSFANDPNPSLCSTGALGIRTCTPNPVPQIQTREMESVLQLVSGQTAILGGLMQDNFQYNRNYVPGVGNPAYTGGVSEVFGIRDDRVAKSELVVFLRPTIVANASLESEELKFYQRFLPQQPAMIERPPEKSAP
jgi:general secretion pathway protein D